MAMNARPSTPTDPVGLRILVHAPGATPEPCVAANSTVMARRKVCSVVPLPRRPTAAPALPELGFLKACFLCRKALSPVKDTYMYGGDRAFCSKECRCKQMSMDETREFEEAARKRRSKRMAGRVRVAGPATIWVRA